MERKRFRAELLFSLGFLFTLVLAVAAFFYGVKIGADRTEIKYQPMLSLSAAAEQSPIAYQQQDLVSFYHTVFLPYREFQVEWQAGAERMATSAEADARSIYSQLAKTAVQLYEEVQRATVSPVSPLLEGAQVNTLKSIRLFEQTAERRGRADEALLPAEKAAALRNDAYYQQAVTHALQAQQQYYEAMLKWGASVDPEQPSDFETTDNLSIDDWQALTLLTKNKFTADQLVSRQAIFLFYPHDLSSRIDDFIATGQADSMGITTVNAIADLLLSTRAVRSGDYAASKDILYSTQLLPQLPFFFPEKT